MRLLKSIFNVLFGKPIEVERFETVAQEIRDAVVLFGLNPVTYLVSSITDPKTHRYSNLVLREDKQSVRRFMIIQMLREQKVILEAQYQQYMTNPETKESIRQWIGTETPDPVEVTF